MKKTKINKSLTIINKFLIININFNLKYYKFLNILNDLF